MIKLDDDRLTCPACGNEYTHLTQVIVAARHEDGPEKHIAVQPKTGQIDLDQTAPTGNHVGQGRRHRTALMFSCEGCGGDFAVTFTQHKGETLVESLPQ